MNWKFWQKKKPVEQEPVRRFEIPPHRVQAVLYLSDEVERVTAGKNREARFLLWTEISDMFPEVRYGNWGLEFPNALHVEVVERRRQGDTP